ncbi:MAG: hypothetical protein ABJF11_12055 [Reichenbachiella sp.]|uniref:hypothetical protein n=1 Tax=Reichenbachiella sp. TaxID=2184521 RepID=UPI003262D71E
MKKIMLVLIATMVFGACSDEKEENTTATKWRGSWTPRYPNLYHDGEPVEGENFIVYSDKSSQTWRKEVAVKAEESLSDIMTRFDLKSSDFDFVPLQDERKIHILTNYDQWNIALAYRDGIIIRSKDGPNFFGDHQTWQYVFQHEITHVIEFLLIGTPSHSNSSSVWMREGFGNYGARNHRIQSVEELEAWREKMKDVEGEGNPISIVGWSDFPESVVSGGTTGEYYGFFELGVRYILDEEKGNGTNIDNLKAYFEDIGDGVSYKAAFLKHFNMDADEFRDNYWTIMKEYLEQPE